MINLIQSILGVAGIIAILSSFTLSSFGYMIALNVCGLTLIMLAFVIEAIKYKKL
jgi:hypothetical protein